MAGTLHPMCAALQAKIERRGAGLLGTGAAHLLAARTLAGAAAPEARTPGAADFSDVVDELYGLLETPVRIRSGKRGGTIQIAFRSKSELERLVGLLRSLGG